jgi:hypothetical protein
MSNQVEDLGVVQKMPQVRRTVCLYLTVRAKEQQIGREVQSRAQFHFRRLCLKESISLKLAQLRTELQSALVYLSHSYPTIGFGRRSGYQVSQCRWNICPAPSKVVAVTRAECWLRRVSFVGGDSRDRIKVLDWSWGQYYSAKDEVAQLGSPRKWVVIRGRRW